MRKLLIPNSYVDRAAWLVDEADLVEHVTELLDLAPQGRPRRVSLRTIHIGYFLGIQLGGSFKSTTCYQVLSEGISRTKQLELGTRWEGGRIRKSHVDYLAKRLAGRGYYTAAERAARGEQDVVSDEELQRREAVVRRLVDGLLATSIIDPTGAGWFAVDGTGLWAHSRSAEALGSADDVRADEDVHDELGEPVLVDADGVDANGRRWFGDADAAEGVKTAKRGGREHYFGYVVDAMVRTSKPGGDPQPLVFESMFVSPASTDVVAPTLAMLDTLAARDVTVSDITVDRHYSHKAEQRWAAELRQRGIFQHLDLRSDDQRVVDHDGLKILAGRAYCPALSDTLYDIPKPGLNATDAEWQTFHGAISKRQRYEMPFHERPRADGRARVLCPAMAGQAGCPLRDGTVEIAEAAGLPVFRNAPAPDVAPTCCTNSGGVVAVRSERLTKLYQPHTWGTPAWFEAFDKRTYVEGGFGIAKDPDHENLGRNYTKFTGLLRATLGTAMVFASVNMRTQTKFYAEHDPGLRHPLLDVSNEVVWDEAA